MDLRVSLIGFVIGFLVGLTGMGGAALMTPVMIIVLGVRPVLAVGTDLVYAAITKIFGAWQHWRLGTVDFGVVKYLAMGSVPSSLAAVALAAYIQSQFGDQVDAIVGRMLGFVLLLVGAGVMARAFIGRTGDAVDKGPLRLSSAEKKRTIILGATVGLIVGLTSVGSGTLIVVVLVLLYPLASTRVVGTDVVHAAFLVSVAAFGHWGVGNVDFALAGNLLIGSIPGVLLGSRMSVKIPEKLLRPTLALVLIATGLKLA